MHNGSDVRGCEILFANIPTSAARILSLLESTSLQYSRPDHAHDGKGTEGYRYPHKTLREGFVEIGWSITSSRDK